jgi:hypothetical protein
MLELDQRRIFMEALRPPTGYVFDRGIGTSFTLDLTALLITPLSLALLDHNDNPEDQADPLLLLESLRKFADRLTIFCQAGRISIPKNYNHLYHYLENCVVEVQAPLGGVFHPKVWLMRYEAEEKPALYRLLVMTRNLTFDKSWDIIAQLDGELADRQVGYSRNRPLGDFVKALPELALNSPAQETLSAIDQLQEEVRRVKFETPDSFSDEYHFHPMGIPGYRKSFLFKRDYDKALVMSPFLQDSILKKISEKKGEHVLISETQALDALQPETLEKYPDIFHVDSSLWDTEEEEDPTEADALTLPAGLHAKLFVLNHGWHSTWLIGSANATRPALSGFARRNVEFMLELSGKRSKIGIEQLLGDVEDDMAMRNLLRTYQYPEQVESVDQDSLEAERLADEVREWLIDLRCTINISAGEKEDTFQAMIDPSHPAPRPDGKYSVYCWPVSVPDAHRKVFLPDSNQTVFQTLSILALTPFIAFSIRANAGKAKHQTHFVVQLPIFGMPADREDYLIQAVISDRSQFLRFLRLILSQDPSELWRDPDWINNSGASAEGKSHDKSGIPLLEELLRALSRSPEKIDRIDEIVQRLSKTAEGKAVMPEGFETLWKQFTDAKRGNQ